MTHALFPSLIMQIDIGGQYPVIDLQNLYQILIFGIGHGDIGALVGRRW